MDSATGGGFLSLVGFEQLASGLRDRGDGLAMMSNDATFESGLRLYRSGTCQLGPGLVEAMAIPAAVGMAVGGVSGAGGGAKLVRVNLLPRAAAKPFASSARPKGVPVTWIAQPTRSGGGTRFVDPSNPHNSVRVMPGNPNSPFPNSQRPYVRHIRDGNSLDIEGKVVSKTSPDAHIPLEEFVWPF